MELVKRSYEEPGTYLHFSPDDACDNTHRFTGHEQKYFDVILQRPSSKWGRESSECEARKEIHRRESFEGRLLPTRALRGRGNHPPSQKGYMHFRYYAGSIGRFSKPDNVTGNAMNPQDWNLYSYVHGNPVNFNDPTGHMAQYVNPKGEDPNHHGMLDPDIPMNDNPDSQDDVDSHPASQQQDTTTPENSQTLQQTDDQGQNDPSSDTQVTMRAATSCEQLQTGKEVPEEGALAVGDVRVYYRDRREDPKVSVEGKSGEVAKDVAKASTKGAKDLLKTVELVDSAKDSFPEKKGEFYVMTATLFTMDSCPGRLFSCSPPDQLIPGNDPGQIDTIVYCERVFYDKPEPLGSGRTFNKEIYW